MSVRPTPRRDTRNSLASDTINTKSIDEARLRTILEKKMDTINPCMYKLYQMRLDIRQFEDSYEGSKQSVRSTAHALIQKIKEHESRMLDELETQRELEYKRTDLTNTKRRMQEIEHNFTNAQQTQQDNCNCTAGAKDMCNNVSGAYVDNVTLQISEVDTLADKLQELRCLMFSKIRCNTAFGTVELQQKRTPHRNQSIGGRKMSMVHPSPPKLSLDNHFHQRSDSKDSTDQERLSADVLLRRNRKLSLQMVNGIGLSNSPRLSASQNSSRLSYTSSSDGSDAFIEDSQPLELLWATEKEGSALGEINCPSDVAFQADGTLVVCDRGNQRVQIFNKVGQAVKTIGDNKIKPCRVSTTKSGQIILSDSKENNVCVYDKKGNCQTVLGKKLFRSVSPFKAPCAVASKAGKQFIVSDVERNDVAIYNSDGKLVAEIGKQCGDCIEFKKPSYIHVNQEGRILVSDNLNHCVQVFDTQGKFLFRCVLRNKGSQSDLQNDTNYLKYPNGVCCDEQGNIYVADWGSHTVTQFNRNGEFVCHVLTREDGVIHPAGVAVFGDELAVCGYSDTHSSVQVFKLAPAAV